MDKPNPQPTVYSSPCLRTPNVYPNLLIFQNNVTSTKGSEQNEKKGCSATTRPQATVLLETHFIG